MWGEIANITVGSLMGTQQVTLARMVAKIDVVLTTDLAKGKFNLESVRLYNYNDQGGVAPVATNWNPTTSVATTPSVPGTAKKPTDPANNPLTYDGDAITKDDIDPTRGVSCTGEIYTFEAVAGTDAGLTTNTCLVIGGKYGTDAQTTYYRIDFANTSGQTIAYLPLLRNHQYKVNITKVKSPGLATATQAFNSRPVNIEASVISWSEGDITDVVFDGQYMLGVSKRELSFTREQRTASSQDNDLKVTTDFPTGWKVEKITVNEDGTGGNADWLSLSPNSGSTGQTSTTKLLLDENTTGATRTGYIHLTAGRLNYTVKVEQLSIANIRIFSNEKEVTELVFSAAVGRVAIYT
jgi:hypothetical protein